MQKINAALKWDWVVEPYDMRATGTSRFNEANVNEQMRLESQGHSSISSEHSYRWIDSEAWAVELAKVGNLI